MKQWLVILFGAFCGLAQAQSVNWPGIWSGCAAEARAYDAQAQSANVYPEWTSRRVQSNFEKLSGSPATIAKVQANIQEAKNVLANPKEWTLLIQIGYKLGLCGSLAALNQLQSGSTQSASSSLSRPSSPPPSSRGNGRNQPDKVAVHCMDEVGNGVMRNRCNQQVNVRWCSLSQGPNTCGSGNLGWADVPPGGTAEIARDVKVQLIACADPTRPTDIEYSSGSGFLYNCTD